MMRQRSESGNRNRKPKRKVCIFCTNKDKVIDYKEFATLRKFTTERGKIFPRRVSGACAKHQRALTAAIQRARMIALLPFSN